MWFLLVFLYPVAILGLKSSILLSSEFFTVRRVPFVCVVNCENDLPWVKGFAKISANKSISVSSFSVNQGYPKNMEKCFYQNHTLVGVLVKMNCEHVDSLLFTASENKWFDSEHVWLLIEKKFYNATVPDNDLTNFGNDSDLGKVMETMQKLNISVNADIKMAYPTDPYNYKVLDVFNFGKVQGGTLKVVDAGNWSLSTGFSADFNMYKYYKRWDFGQWPMRLVSVATLPPNNFDPNILTSVIPVYGVTTVTRTSTIILMIIAEVHNIRFVHTVADRWVTNFEGNDTRSAAKSLYRGEQDVTTTLRMIFPVTTKVGFMVPALTSLETRYFYRIPTKGPGRYENQFLRPLSVGAWGSTVGISILCMVTLVAAARLERRPSSVQYAMFSVMANVCQQFFEDESEIVRSSAARKLTVFITGLSCVLIYNYYTSSVVSWLLNGPPPSITSLEELLESPLELIYQDVGYTRSWLSGPGSYYYNKRNMEVEDRIRRKIKTRTQESLLKPLEEGIALVKVGGYAYHTETDSADELISKILTQSEICELGSLKSMEKTLLYPAVQRNSPYKEFLSWSLMGLLERGFMSCIQQRTISRPVSCKGSSPRALALGGAAPAFIMLTLGYFISTAFMLVERFIHSKTNKNQNLV